MLGLSLKCDDEYAPIFSLYKQCERLVDHMNQMKFLSFWSINDKLDLTVLKQQLVAFRKSGLDGVIFHPRYYPNTPEYLSEAFLSIVDETIMYAKEIGLSFWLYDENGWPSGTASGKVLEQLPDSTCEWLEYTDENSVEIRSKIGVNSLDPQNVSTFINITYEGYKNGLSKTAFDYVEGFFSDEVGFLDSDDLLNDNTLPWSEQIEERYKEKFNESMLPSLHKLFNFEDGAKDLKQRYWEILTDLLAETFYQPINEWCEDNGKRYTMHLKGEENLLFQMAFGGSSFQNLKYVNVPGIDALERHPSNNYFPRIASSVAKQFYDGTALCEAMGGSGWGVNPQSFEQYIKWLIDGGINTFVFHLSQYELKASAIRDWPPSMPLHLSWAEAFPAVIAKLREYAANRKDDNNVLLVAPTRGVMRAYTPEQATVLNIHNGADVQNTPAGVISKQFSRLVEDCHRMGYQFDVTEERIIEQHAQIHEDGIQIGHIKYNKIIIGNGCVFEIDVDDLAKFVVTDNTDWELKNPGQNQYLLDLTKQDSGELTIEIPAEDLSRETTESLAIKTSDEVEAKTIEILENHIKISVMPGVKEEDPFVWLTGDFTLKTEAVYLDKGHQVFTDGPFRLDNPSKEAAAFDLIESGYPFRTEAFVLTKNIKLYSEIPTIKLTGVDANAVRVTVNNECLGWFFGPNFEINGPFKAGNNEIKVELVPSTFNMYGPHHHYNGDRHLTSPLQYVGEKNFADFNDAPDKTHVDGWHFVKCGIGATVLF